MKEIVDYVFPVFADPASFDKKFLQFKQAEDEATNEMILEGDTGRVKAAFEEWLDATVTEAAARLFAQLLFKVLSHEFEECLKGLAREQLVQFADFARTSPAPLAETFRAFLDVLRRGGGVLDTEGAPGEELGAGGEDGDGTERTAMWTSICATRRQTISVSALKTKDLVGDTGTVAELWKTTGSGGKAMRIFRESRFAKAKGVPGEKHRAMLLSVDLLTHSFAEAGKDCPHLLMPEKTPELEAALAFLTAVRDSDMVLLVFDGRCSREARRLLTNWHDDQDPAKQCENWVLYQMPSNRTAGMDVRFPKRKVAFRSKLQEILYTQLPVPVVRMKSKPRTELNACGETSTHCATYTGVPMRLMTDLPLLEIAQKNQIVGFHVPPLPEKVAKALRETGFGVPLFWSEAKPVTLFANVFRDYNVEHVFDLGVGTAAAATAAAFCGIGYEGLCVNEAHCEYVNAILDRAVLALLGSKADSYGYDNSQAQKIQKYFASTIQEALRHIDSGVGQEEGDEEGDDAASTDSNS